MKIVVNAISAQTGGIVTYTNNLIEQALKHEIPLLIFVPRDFQELHPVPPGSDIEIRRCHASTYGPVRRFLWEQIVWRREVRNSKADILYSSANYGLLYSPLPQVLMIQGEISFDPFYRKHTLPLLSYRERIAAALRRCLSAASARHSDIVVLPSRTAMENVLSYSPSLRTKTIVNWPGVVENFMQDIPKRSWRNEGGLSLFFHSVYYPHKAPHGLVKAAQILREKGIDARVRLTFEDRDFENWDLGTDDLKILRQPQFADFLKMGRIAHTDLPEALSQQDVFVFPSLSETFGFPMVEAMAATIPVVAADTRINREICGDAALYYEPDDPEDLARRIMELDQDPQLRTSFAGRQRARVREKYTWTLHFEKLIQDFRNLYAGQPPSVMD